MAGTEGPDSTEIDAELEREVNVTWSRTRCWHGETVTIRVRTNHVPDGTAVILRIFPDDVAGEIVSVEGLTINGSSLDHDYTIDWGTTAIPEDASEFVVRAVIDENPSDPSPTLVVDLNIPIFSA